MNTNTNDDQQDGGPEAPTSELCNAIRTFLGRRYEVSGDDAMLYPFLAVSSQGKWSVSAKGGGQKPAAPVTFSKAGAELIAALCNFAYMEGCREFIEHAPRVGSMSRPIVAIVREVKQENLPRPEVTRYIHQPRQVETVFLHRASPSRVPMVDVGSSHIITSGPGMIPLSEVLPRKLAFRDPETADFVTGMMNRARDEGIREARKYFSSYLEAAERKFLSEVQE